MGLGKSGFAAAVSLQESGAEFIVWDDKEAAREKAASAKYKVADPVETDLSGYEALILSPGIPLTHPAPHPVVEKCRAARVQIISEVELLLKACPNATYIGITGTNGKSTTTALVHHILSSSGRKSQVGGNLGTPALALEPLGADGFYVLEQSSFQLDLLKENPFKVAALLNITPDHFDRHGDMKGYIDSKSKIIRKKKAQTLVLGTDEPETVELANKALKQKNLKVIEISVQHEVKNGIACKDQKLFAYPDENAKPIVDMAAIKRLPGTHNAQNACAAYAICKALGLTDTEIVSGLKSFPGLAHRQQFVAEIGGVRFINDSKATNAEATGKALACYENIYWIVGGKPKANGLNGLEPFMPRIKHAFLIGMAAEDFAKWLDGKTSYTLNKTMDAALKHAAEMAWVEKKPNSVVLLSPACASFDQFSGFEERGEVFSSLVNDIISSRGMKP